MSNARIVDNGPTVKICFNIKHTIHEPLSFNLWDVLVYLATYINCSNSWNGWQSGHFSSVLNYLWLDSPIFTKRHVFCFRWFFSWRILTNDALFEHEKSPQKHTKPNCIMPWTIMQDDAYKSEIMFRSRQQLNYCFKLTSTYHLRDFGVLKILSITFLNLYK